MIKKLEDIIKEDVPAMLAILKEKFSSSSVKKFIADNGELIYDGELAVGLDVSIDFNKEMDDCMKKKMDEGKSKDEAQKMCMVGKMERIPAPTRTYKHADGTEIVVESGKIVDIKKPTAGNKTDMKAMAEELFKAFPKTDLTAIEASLAELKTTLASIQTERADLKAKVDKFDSFKTEVIGILDKFSKSSSAPASPAKKTDSSKSIFNTELTFEERVKLLQKEQN